MALLSYTVTWDDKEEQAARSIKRFPYDLRGRAAEECPGRTDPNFTTSKPSKEFAILITLTHALISQPITKGNIALWKGNCRSLRKENYARDSIILQNRRQANAGGGV